jgi:Carboxypeptidase regulatory-like domain
MGKSALTKSLFHSLCILTVILALAAPFTFSQSITTADAVGVITDSSGAVVPGATVTIRSSESGETRTVTANDQGQYRFPLMKPGEYTITAASKGLKSNITRITLQVGQEQEVNVTMNAQGNTTIIEVTSEAPIVQTENANLETNYNTAQVIDLPMAGGDLTTLAMTAPGIRVNITGGSSNMNANGIPGASILYTLNGMDQNDPANNLNNSGASNNLLGQNSVAEAAVVLNAYSPQYGRMAGAQVNLVGFSGTNQYHGNLFYNFNNQSMNANAFFNNATNTRRGRSDAHQFGGRIGGPILKNKLFAFYDNENLRYVLPAAGVVSLPSPALQAYTLAHVPATTLPLYQDYFNLVSGSPGINRAVLVNNGTGQLQDGNNHMGCGNGTFTGTPTGTGGIFGVNTSCAQAFGVNDTEINTEQQYTVRVDYNISNNQKFFARLENDHGVQATGTSPINPLYNSVSVQPSWQGSVNHTWVISPNMVNNFVGSVLWYQALFGVADFSKTQALMPDSIAIADGGANGGGFATVGAGAFPNGRNVGHVQFSDDFSWTKGRHTFKAGIAYRYDKYTYTSIASGAFLGAYSLNDLADFANGKLNSSGTGLGSSFAQSYPKYGALHFRFPSADYYVSDEWAVSKNIKLTYGARFEEDLNPTCNETCFVLTNVPFDSPQYQGGASIPYNSTIQTKSNLYYNAEKVIFQPRVGVAWKPFGNDKTVIRGGVGLFSTNYTDGIGGTFANQIPNKFAPGGLNFGTVGVAADPTSSAFAAQASANAFFSGFGSGFTLAQLQNAVKPAAFGTPSITTSPETYLAPKDIEWSFEIQHAINVHNMLTASYVANHGYDLAETVNDNAYAAVNATFTSRYGATFGGLPTAAPDPRFVTVTQYYNNGVSNYNSLTLTYRHTTSFGLTSQIHYTWSHTLGTVAYENPLNLQGSYGNLGFDNRHQLAGDLLWTSPRKFSNRMANAITGGWIFATKLYLYSGAPFTPTDSKIPAQINSAGGILTPIADVIVPTAFNANCGRAAINAPCLPKTDFATYNSTSGVATPIQTDWGNVSPGQIHGPGYFDIDTNIARNFRIHEKMVFNIGLQAYNVLNHPNFANPSGTLSSGSFGLITSTLGPPTSIYGTGQGSAVSGRLMVVTGMFTF